MKVADRPKSGLSVGNRGSIVADPPINSQNATEVQALTRGGICKLSLGGSWDSWRIVPNVYNATP